MVNYSSFFLAKFKKINISHEILFHLGKLSGYYVDNLWVLVLLSPPWLPCNLLT
jgi:hypothetical protein